MLQIFRPFVLMAGMLLGSTAAKAEGPAYFISIDGLQPSLLRTLKDEGVLKAPRGFSWLMDHSLVVDRALPIVTSITAPSHISTITCSPPSRHGVIANDFLRDGKKVSGFEAPFGSEPLWRAAMRQGRKVLSLAYVGADGRTEDRSATYGLAYPDPKRLGPGQMLTLAQSQLSVAKDWSLPSELRSLTLSEYELSITLNPETQEKRKIHFLIKHGASRPTEIWVARSKDLARDGIGILRDESPALDIFLDESLGQGSPHPRRRRTIVRLLPPDSKEDIRIAVSKSTYNEAYPETFRARLDALNLVWPDYSVRGMNLPTGEATQAQGLIDRFLTEVAVRMVPELQVDLVLFYQPLLDTIGHELQSRLPLPFHPASRDEVSRAFVAGFRQIDENLSQLLAAAGETTPIGLMGDHGMDAVQRMVNVSALLRPGLQHKVRFLSSGQLLLLYPAPGFSAQDVDAVGLELRKNLVALRDLQGGRILAQASRRQNFHTEKTRDYRTEWQYGDAVWAFQARSGHWLTFDSKARELYQSPRASGMHGTAVSESSMATSLLIHGPRIPKKRVPEANLIQAVPTFAELMGIAPPADCLGESLMVRERISQRDVKTKRR